MNRVAWLVVWTIAWSLGTPGFVRGAAIDLRHDLAAGMRAADTVCVYRFVRIPGSPDSAAVDSAARSTPRWRPFDSMFVDSTWGRRFVSMLERSTFHEGGRCEVEHDSNDSLQARVSLAGAKGRFAVYLQSPGCGRLAWGQRWIGSFEFEPAVSREIAALLVRAHARDSIRTRSSARAPAPASAPAGVAVPRQPETRSTPGTDPKFGDYVFVEELPEALTKVPPSYPDAARKAGVDGMVIIQALVGKDGRVKDARVTKSIPPLDESAMQCVRQWIFKPAMAGGAPVAVWVAVPIKFTLH